MQEPTLSFEQKSVGQLVEAELYNNADHPFVCIDGLLFWFNGRFYEPRTDAQEEKRIADFLNEQQVLDPKTNRLKYPYANRRSVKESLCWVKSRCSVKQDIMNPPGINCTNGILRLRFEGSDVIWELIPHSPNIIYTYEPLIEYNPNAPTEECDRMLAVLDPSQRDIFLKIAAAAIDLEAVRRRVGRQIRIGLMYGGGSNGKDALRQGLFYLFGNVGVTSIGLNDFRAYDQGKKFGVANLINSRVNWASENVRTVQIDNIQSLKAFITGDPLICERKHCDPVEFVPHAIAFFNVNETPFLTGALKAVSSRYVIFTFNKVFSENPDHDKGELQADPRFKYDREFICQQVLPAFLALPAQRWKRASR